jgi:hypothetical protein
MVSFDSFKENIIVALCGLIFVIVSLSPAFASEKPSAILSDQSGCQALLLTNEDYFPALIKAFLLKPVYTKTVIPIASWGTWPKR